jgi:hypothetical protein
MMAELRCTSFADFEKLINRYFIGCIAGSPHNIHGIYANTAAQLSDTDVEVLRMSCLLFPGVKILGVQGRGLYGYRGLQIFIHLSNVMIFLSTLFTIEIPRSSRT